MNLSQLTDLELDKSAISAANNERAALHVVLEHIAEVNRRKSFSPKFKSIHAYVMGEMKYDNKSAWRRVNAAFLMVQLPEIKESIKNGELNLSKLVTVQNHIRNENEALSGASKKNSPAEPSLFGDNKALDKKKLTREEKLDAVKAVIGKTSEEAERVLASKSSAPEKSKRPEQVKPRGGDSNEVRIYLSDEDLKIVRELKELLAHKHPNASLGAIVSIALNEAKASIEKKKAGKAAPRAE